MKHKKSSISIPHVLEVFAQSQFEQFSFLYINDKKSPLSRQELEALLLSMAEKTCEPNFILQKYMKTDSEISSTIDFIKQSVKITDYVPIDSLIEITGQSKKILSFLSKAEKSLISGTLKVLYFTSLSLVKHKDPVNRCSSARSQNTQPTVISIRRRSRPLTALTELRSSAIQRDSISSIRIIHQSPKKSEEKDSQTEEKSDCGCEAELKRTTEELLLTFQENEELENEIKEMIAEGKRRKAEAESKWKAKCLEIYEVITDKMLQEKNRCVEEMRKGEECYNR